MNKTLLFALFIIISVSTSAQLKVDSYGRVSVGNNNPRPNYLLSVRDTNTTNFSGYCGVYSRVYPSKSPNPGSYDSYGVFSHGMGSSYNRKLVGVYGYAGAGTSGKRYGVIGSVSSSSNGAGIYGTSGVHGSVFGFDVPGVFAGYFDGSVYVDGDITASGIITPSDMNQRENITSINDEENRNGSTLDNLMKMNVVKYSYKEKKREIDSTEKAFIEEERQLMEQEGIAIDVNKGNTLPQKHYGLSAQELQEIYPDLVYKGQDGNFGINYVELVPILIRSIQELKQELDAVKRNGARMTRSAFSGDEDEMSTSASQNMLYQNTPNPFKEQTTIRFSLADDVTDAAICIFDMTGKMLKKLPVSPGETSVKINGWELGEGMFLYTLMVNGQEVDTKKMIITR